MNPHEEEGIGTTLADEILMLEEAKKHPLIL
jgi:hypothetical protein